MSAHVTRCMRDVFDNTGTGSAAWQRVQASMLSATIREER